MALLCIGLVTNIEPISWNYQLS